ncbi:MAG: hypothetical protein FWG77_00945 [Treponema sp.]|nr:hypothetical protein [Treponema sp.]
MHFLRDKFFIIALIFIVLIIGAIIISGNPAILTFFLTLGNPNLRPGSISETITILIPDTVSNAHLPQDPDRRLRDISLVRQHDSVLCLAASIYMVENFYFGESLFTDVPYDYREPTSWAYLREIFNQIAVYDINGRAMGGTFPLAAQYMGKRGLLPAIVYILDLKEILMYLEVNQIPAILSMQSIGSYLASHAVVFTGYDPEEDVISILDPADPNNTFMSRDELLGITRNTIVFATDFLNNEIAYFCPIDNHRIAIDESILNAISGLICPACHRFSYIPGREP